MKVSDSTYDKLSLVLVASFFFFFLGLIARQSFGPTGESASYIMGTIAFERHPFTQRIDQEDISQMQAEFPEHINDIGRSPFFINQDGEQYPWYFPTYSISVLPVKLVFQLLNITLIKAYLVSNVLYYSISLLIVYFFLKVSRKMVFLSILLLVCSPAILYYVWISAEMFICSMVIISLTFWVSGNRFLAGLFCAIASTLNIALCGICIIMIIEYCIDDYLFQNMPIKALIKMNWRNTIKFGACFIPSLFMPLHNIWITGSINLQDNWFNSLDLHMYDNWWGRVLAYLFDLNFGFFPYYPVLLIMLFLTLVLSVYLKKRQSLMILIGFFAALGLYSLMPHINCGMTGIHRYNAWMSPFLIFSATVLLPSLINSINLKKIVSVMSMASVLISSIVLFVFVMFSSKYHIEFTFIAKSVLEHVPAIYNPLASTFAGRTRHMDHAYSYIDADEPTIYIGDDGFIKKILVPRNVSADIIMEKITGDELSLLLIEKEISKIKSKNKRYAYINAYNTIYPAALIDAFNPLENTNLAYLNRGIYYWENTFHWFSPNATIWMRTGDLRQTGLEFEFYPAPYLEPFDQQVPLSTTIFINDIMAFSVSLADKQAWEVIRITIDGADLPATEANTYRIDIITNGAYNPSKTNIGERYNPNDPRDLTIGVTYIGPVR